MGATEKVLKVRLQNRADCCPERLQGVSIYLSDVSIEQGGLHPKALVVSDVHVPQETPLNVTIGAAGRYLSVRRLHKDGPKEEQGLTLCEIEVLASRDSAKKKKGQVGRDSEPKKKGHEPKMRPRKNKARDEL